MIDRDTLATTFAPPLVSVLRIVTALLFLEHATSKLFAFPPTPMQPALFSLPGFAGMLELVGSTLLILGLFTRPVAFILSGEMAVAYFGSHVPHGGFFPLINHGESAILFCFIYLYIVAAGPGPWSVDHMRIGRGAAMKPATVRS